MTYDHQPHVSRVVWQSFAAIADNHPEGMSRDGLIEAALKAWLAEHHPDILNHYLEVEENERAFRKSLKAGSGITTDLQAPSVVKESTP